MHKPTGRVLSERALKEVPSAVEEMLGGKPAPDTLLPINPTGDDLARLKEAVGGGLRDPGLPRPLLPWLAPGTTPLPLRALCATHPRTCTGALSPPLPHAPTPRPPPCPQVGARLAAEQAKKAKKDKKRAAAVAAADAAAVAANGSGGAAAGGATGGAAGDDPASLPPALKRAKAAADKVPAGATPSVYASIFHKSGEERTKETYCCRAVSGRPTLMN